MRSLISIDFPAPEMEPESAHVVSAVSVPSSNAAIAMQHFSVQHLHGFRQVVQHVQLHVAKLGRMVNWCKHGCLLIE